MAVKPGVLMKRLDKLVSEATPETFALEFLKAYGIPKNTLTQIRKKTGRNETDEPNAIALKNKIFIKPVAGGDDVFERAEALAQSESVRKHKIRFVLVTDFEAVVGHDVSLGERMECDFKSLPRHYSFFLALAGYERIRHDDEAEADVRAAARMGLLCDQLREANEVETEAQRHRLNVFMTRLLFCLYAEDTGIFGANAFTDTFRANTLDEATNAAGVIQALFRVLNTPEESRQVVPEHLVKFPYVNGGLFEHDLEVPVISPRARRSLIDAGKLDWKTINPDIFGSMFQAVIDPEQRGTLGQHYTSVGNILKVIRPLFLDELDDELEKARRSPTKLRRLLHRLHTIRVFDPSTGCGNFLIIAYKELRRIEICVFQALDEAACATDEQDWLPESQGSMFPGGERQPRLKVTGQREIYMSGIHLDQFYGIEIEDFAHEVARLALWIAEHQMQKEFKAAFGDAEPTLPLRAGGNVICDNALRVDWRAFCDPSDTQVYVCGNPPYLGWRNRTAEQNADMEQVFEGFRIWKNLDFVAAWVWKATQYVADTDAECGFVTTNSICQGEQVHMLWPKVQCHGVELSYAYQSFPWKNSARNSAGVHVIVFGLRGTGATGRKGSKTLFERVDVSWHARPVSNISPYLVEGPDTAVEMVSSPICNVPRMLFGNMPNDHGHLLLDAQERDELLRAEPQAGKWLKPILGSNEFFKGVERWCLWLTGASEAEINGMPAIRARVESVKHDRLASTDAGARKLADRPHEFRDLNNPSSYLLVPSVSSEQREYAPIGFYDSGVIASNLVYIVPEAGLLEFAVISSAMHMEWLRLVGGRLKSDYRYSAGLVYNTFPWPDISDQARNTLEELAQNILDVREGYFHLSMGELYHPKTMPGDLLQAHHDLDRAVELLYRAKPFADSAERQAFLLERYKEIAHVQ